MQTDRDDDAVAVIIPAFNASATVADAVASALAEPQVREVAVVDDASTDDTLAAARAADDGTGRLRLERLARNSGPSAARNAAIALTSAPLIALLDSDDRLVPGRFSWLSGDRNWDFAADDIVFVASPEAAVRAAAEHAQTLHAAGPRRERLDLTQFVERNLPRRGAARRELGFLHPVMSRAFLERHGLRYDDTMRLGEDFDLYARALIEGARFDLVHAKGYVAVERPGSLSAQHRVEDLAAFHASAERLLAHPRLAPQERRALRRHANSVSQRYELRRFLQDKTQRGIAPAALSLVRRPAVAPGVASGIARDKWAAFWSKPSADRRPTTLFGNDSAQPLQP